VPALHPSSSLVDPPRRRISSPDCHRGGAPAVRRRWTVAVQTELIAGSFPCPPDGERRQVYDRLYRVSRDGARINWEPVWWGWWRRRECGRESRRSGCLAVSSVTLPVTVGLRPAVFTAGNLRYNLRDAFPSLAKGCHAITLPLRRVSGAASFSD
jgi:hypothetical protein